MPKKCSVLECYVENRLLVHICCSHFPWVANDDITPDVIKAWMESAWCGLCLARNVYRHQAQVTFRRFAARMSGDFRDNKNKFYRVVLTGGMYKLYSRSMTLFYLLVIMDIWTSSAVWWNVYVIGYAWYTKLSGNLFTSWPRVFNLTRTQHWWWNKTPGAPREPGNRGLVDSLCTVNSWI